MSYLFCFNVDTLSMRYSHRNCVVIGCPNSRQRLGKWAATTCELHGCNNGSRMCSQCVASVSVEFGSKERPRNGVFGILPARKMGREPKKERWG